MIITENFSEIYCNNNVTINNTDNSTIGLDPLQVIVYVVYIGAGSFSASANLMLLIIFFLYKNVKKKELLILVGSTVGDFLYGIGFIFGGARRLQLVLKNIHMEQVSPWFCQKEPSTFLYIFGAQLSALMNVMVSFDRLIAVTWFHTYNRLTTRYVLGVTSGVVMFVTASYFTGFVLSANMDRNASVSVLCWSTQASWSSYGTYYTTLIASANCTGIVVYIVVMLVLKVRAKNAHASLQNVQQKRQLKVTKVIALSSCADFLMDVVPWVVQVTISAVDLPESFTRIVSPLTFLIIQARRTVTVSIYIYKFSEMRQAFILFVSCKIKP